ncbi:MAG: DUF6252 family protein [Gemmatimonadaceae bacterium]
MRRLLCYTLIAALGATAACSGGSGPAGPQPGAAGPGTMTAQVNGSAWTASALKRAFFTSGLLTIQGSDGSRIITIVVRTSTTGSFSLDVGNGLGHNAIYTVVPASNWGTALGGSGTITISAINASNVSGTFMFTGISNISGTAPAQITNGQFNLPIS